MFMPQMFENNDSWHVPKPKDRKIFFGKQVDQESIEDVVQQIIYINDNDRYLEKLFPLHNLVYVPKPIEIYIDSYGGDVYQIFGLLSIMENSVTPIYTIVTGNAMSAGFIMLVYGHKRFAHEFSTVMYHPISSGFFGKIQDLETSFKEIKRLQIKYEELITKKTKITKEKLEEIREQGKDWYMNSKQAKENGVIDEII